MTILQSISVIGIDPGLVNTGYGVIRKDSSGIRILDMGTVKTTTKTPMPLRLLNIFEVICNVINNHTIDAMAVEDIHFRAQIVKATILMVHARAAAVLAAGKMSIPVFDYHPNQAKNTVTGYGRATKQQVMQAMSTHLNEYRAGTDQHVADALSIALCHALIATPGNFSHRVK